MKNYLIDTHAHLDFPELYNRLDEVLKNALKMVLKELSPYQQTLIKLIK